MGLSWELLCSPTVGDALKTVTLGDGNDVDVLVLFEDGRDIDGLLEEAVGVFNLFSDRPSIYLDLHEMSLLLAQTSLADLSVGKNTDDSTVFADAFKFTSG